MAQQNTILQHLTGRWFLIITGVIIVGLAGANSALAQQPGFGFRSNIARPTTSPYLNLLRGNPDTDAALNYYRLVRPEQQLRQYSSQLNQQVTGLRQELTDKGLLPSGISTQFQATGHSTSFLNLGGYFSTGGQSGTRPVPRLQ